VVGFLALNASGPEGGEKVLLSRHAGALGLLTVATLSSAVEPVTAQQAPQKPNVVSRCCRIAPE